MTSAQLTRIRDAVITGAFAGLAAGLVFATLHAFIIVPIWDRMIGGLVGAAATGAVVGWAFAEWYPLADEVVATVIKGATFGALLWLAVTPVSLVDAVLRSVGFLPRYELAGIAIAVVLAITAGALWGWRSTRHKRGAVAVAAATLALTLAMGGPVPIGRSIWAFGIFLAVLPACVVAGAILGSGVAIKRRLGATPSALTRAD
jgi:hypothetical protein